MLFLFEGSLAKAGPEWKKYKVIKGLTVFVRNMSHTKMVSIKAVGILEASLPALMSNLRNVKSMPEWLPEVSKKYVVEEPGPLEAITYSLNSMPWPFYDRVLVMHNELKF